jgi:hypothetical protein
MKGGWKGIWSLGKENGDDGRGWRGKGRRMAIREFEKKTIEDELKGEGL